MPTRSRVRKLRRFGLVMSAEFAGGRWMIRAARFEWFGRSTWEEAVRGSDCPAPRDPLDWCQRATVRDVDWRDVDGGRRRPVVDLVDEELRARFGAPADSLRILRSPVPAPRACDVPIAHARAGARPAR